MDKVKTDSLPNLLDSIPADVASAIIEKRITTLTQGIVEAMKIMGIPSSVSEKVIVSIDYTQINANPMVTKIGKDILLDIPAIFLFTNDDMSPNSPLAPLIQRVLLKSEGLNEKEKQTLAVFAECNQQPELAERAKKFVIYHELAHIYHNDFQPPENLEESRAREKRADLTAAHYSDALDGGIHLFKIMSKFVDTQAKTHPTYPDRVAYLTNFETIKDLIEEIREMKMGDPG
ncbi:MAG: hypothetical protein JSS60_01490 [Verrucomicrobia bacterium]|nr:hypothetical protein [Verrucomicrobiota bacterium]